MVICHLVSIIYFTEFACILRCIIWTITIVIVNYICTAISRCTLALRSADWSSWAVRSICAGTCWWIYCWENSLIWTVIWVVNNSPVALISNIGTCICWWNKNSTIWSWIIIWSCRSAICIRDTILRGIIICGYKSIIGCLSCCYKLVAVWWNLTVIWIGNIWKYSTQLACSIQLISTASTCCTLASGCARSSDCTTWAPRTSWRGHCWEHWCIAHFNIFI